MKSNLLTVVLASLTLCTVAETHSAFASQQVLVLRKNALPNATRDLNTTLWLLDELGMHEKLVYDTAMNKANPHDHSIRWDLWATRWSPDGKMLAFIAEEDHSGVGILTIVNADTGEVQRVENAMADLFDLAWSPLGQVAFPSGNNVALASIRDGKLISAELLPTSDRPRKLAWSPDGRLLAAVTDGKLLLLHVNEKKYFDETLVNGGVEMSCAPAWSPDGSRIAFVTHRTLGDFKDLNAKTEYRLATIGVNGKDRQKSNPVETGELEWSSDATLIRTGTQVLLASKLQPHAKSPADRFKRDPLISPEDNYRILFSRPPDEFQVVPVNGNESVVIKGEAIGWRPRPHE